MSQVSGSDLSFLSDEQETQVTDEKDVMQSHFAGSVIPDHDEPKGEEATTA